MTHVQGVVTHVTDVKPLATVITYTDPSNGYEIYQEVRGRGEEGRKGGGHSPVLGGPP